MDLFKKKKSYDIEADVVVIGSGAAGLTAALAAHEGGAKVLLLEKAKTVGGATAVSGGVVWVPNNHHMAGVGVADSVFCELDHHRGCQRPEAGRLQAGAPAFPAPFIIGI